MNGTEHLKASTDTFHDNIFTQTNQLTEDQTEHDPYDFATPTKENRKPGTFPQEQITLGIAPLASVDSDCGTAENTPVHVSSTITTAGSQEDILKVTSSDTVSGESFMFLMFY